MQSLRPNCGEQLVYVAALAVAAKIVYGDVEKHATYRRLYELTTLRDLDYAFGMQARPHWHNGFAGPSLQIKTLGSILCGFCSQKRCK